MVVWLLVFLLLKLVHAEYIWSVDSHNEIDWGNLSYCEKGSEQREFFDTGYGLASSFLYTNAKSQFIQAVTIEPRCIMCHFGILFVCWQPLWLSENFQEPSCYEAQNVLKKNVSFQTSLREQGLVQALLTYTENETLPRVERLVNYVQAMLNLHLEFPSDDEIALLFALALATYISPGEWGAADRGNAILPGYENVSYYKMALSLVQNVLSKKIYHPFALHLLIHLQDAPGCHAIDALHFASHFPIAAPSAWHAHHMPSHLQLRQGLWDQAILANENAINVSLTYIDYLENGLSTFYDGHSAQFLHYSLLQQNQFQQAVQLTQFLSSLIDENSTDLSATMLRVAQTTALANMENASAQLILFGYKHTHCSQSLFDLYKILNNTKCSSCNDPRNLDDMFLWSRQSKASLLFAAGLCSPNSATFYAEEIRSLIQTHSLFQQSLQIAATVLDGIQLANNDYMWLTLNTFDSAVQKQRNLGLPPYGWPISFPAEEFFAAALLLSTKPFQALYVLDMARNDTSTHNKNRAIELFLHAKALLDCGYLQAACREFLHLSNQLVRGDSDALLKSAVHTISSSLCSLSN